jgi:hypothetical protein
MMTDRIYDVPARVMYMPTRDTVKILLAPGQGMVDGGVSADIPLELVPVDLRIPNKELLVTIRNGSVTHVRSDDANGE